MKKLETIEFILLLSIALLLLQSKKLFNSDGSKYFSSLIRAFNENVIVRNQLKFCFKKYNLLKLN